MGEEVDAVLVKKVKQTQEVLGNFIRRPPLTEKHLMKPPFRFIHDIVMAVTDSTGFLYGLYEGPELDAATITTRETKTAWMQKFVDCIKLATNEDIDIKISKILAGQEPAKTNELLILLGNALAKNINSDKAVQAITGKDLSNPSKSNKSPAEGTKEKKKKEATPAATTKTKESSPYSQSVQKKQPAKAPSRAKNVDDDKSKRSVSKPTDVPPKGRQSKAGLAGSPPKGASKAPLPRQASSDRLLGSKTKASVQEKAPPVKTSAQNAKREGRKLSTQESMEDGIDGIQEENRTTASRRGSMTAAAAVGTTVRESKNLEAVILSGPSSGVGEEMPVSMGTISSEAHADDVEQAEFMGSSTTENLTRKNSINNITPPVTIKEEIDDSVDNLNLNETLVSSPAPPSRKTSAAHSRPKTATSSGHASPFASPNPSTSALSLSNAALGPLSLSPVSPAKSLVTFPDINEKIPRPPTARPHTSQMRPGGPLSIARPPSARPAPPRPKTALFADKEDNAFRPTTAKVTTVLLDNEDGDDDNNYIVHEVAPPEKQSSDLQLSESADLGIDSEKSLDNILDPDQRGLLVMQMLDAQSKLEDGSRIAPGANKKTDIERDAGVGDKDRLRWREVTIAEVDKLKNLMQLMARNANPLGKLMDFVQEDVDAMQRDLNKWREESKKLDGSLEAAQEETENSLESLRHRMIELDEFIHEKQDAIAATKMTIFRQEERIRKVLLGLDKVKPRMTNEPLITSADLKSLVEPDDNYDFGSGNSRSQGAMLTGTEPGTFRVLGGCDNHYTTETCLYASVVFNHQAKCKSNDLQLVVSLSGVEVYDSARAFCKCSRKLIYR
ncbi:unnamed protein product [Allacma fusca]|uniref:TRAF3-interacting protein 1 n=1 Tax=Allacma fusca TaxID=39272 RepID=A0A8J2PFU8_9HEXA|nr:unnamed protein product [Allacma fusca]